jgi:UDP-N-acetylglucosamine 2-epimerase
MGLRTWRSSQAGCWGPEGWGYPDRGGYIHVVGAPGLDGIPQNSAKRSERLILVTFHPETMAQDYGVAACRAMLAGLAQYSALGYEIMFCGMNTDPGYREITSEIQDYLRAHGGSVVQNMNHRGYIACMQRAALVIGNSSAGVIEAPWVGCPSVNVGARQDGREMADSVFGIHSGADGKNIADMMRHAMAFSGDPGAIYRGGAAEKIARVCREFVECSGR